MHRYVCTSNDVCVCVSSRNCNSLSLKLASFNIVDFEHTISVIVTNIVVSSHTHSYTHTHTHGICHHSLPLRHSTLSVRCCRLSFIWQNEVYNSHQVGCVRVSVVFVSIFPGVAQAWLVKAFVPIIKPKSMSLNSSFKTAVWICCGCKHKGMI